MAAWERERAPYDEMDLRLWDLQERGVSEHGYRAEVDTLCQRAYKAHDPYRAAWDKCERYCKEQWALLRALEDLAARERAMHALDNDNLAAVCTTVLEA